MAKIIINGVRTVNGKLSAEIENVNGELVCTGSFITHRYFEDIMKLESERYVFRNVEIIRESFGSNDFNILYTFTADDWTIKGGETNLPEEVIEHIERDIYKEEENELIHKEVYEAWKLETK
jgi:hypothetical protein